MYLGGFGGSTLLHLLAAHPRVVAVLGIAGAVMALSSPLGPGAYAGTGRYSTALEHSIASADPDAVARAREEVARVLGLAPEDLGTLVQQTLAECGSGCTDLSWRAVMQDRQLLEQVLLLYLLNGTAATNAGASVRGSVQ